MSQPSEHLSLIASDEDAGARLDTWLAQHLDGLSRSRVQALIREGAARVNGQAVKANHRLAVGQRIELEVPPLRDPRPAPEAMPLHFLYEDDWLAVVDKPAGMTTHPSPGHETGTLVNALLHHCRDLSGIGGERRPGIVHRLDRDTSGLLVVAKHDHAHQALSEALKRREISRLYIAVAAGQPKEKAGTIEAPIGRSYQDRKRMAVNPGDGKTAVTHWEVERWGIAFTILRLRLETGRTHQIRVHLALKRMPVVGDRVYGFDRKQELALIPHERSGLIQAHSRVWRQMLHSTRLEFKHPEDGRPLAFDSPPPADMQDLIDAIPPLETYKESERNAIRRHGA